VVAEVRLIGHAPYRLEAGMIERKHGRIVNMASSAGLRGYPYAAAYVASKHALVGYSRCVAAELAKTGVTLNLVCPHYVESPMTEQIYFVISRDGRTWTSLNEGQPVLVSKLGEKGVRDPFLLRAHDGGKGGKFVIIATDLSINLNRDWGRAVTKGSKSIVVWESTDLVKWSEPGFEIPLSFA